MKTKEKDLKKFNFWKYFAKEKVRLIIFMSLYLIGAGVDIFFSIYTAQILVAVTEALYVKAIRMLVVIFVVHIGMYVIQEIRGRMYDSVSLAIINSMSVDIATQAFKISDSAYSEHGTGAFTQRISGDPNRIFSAVYSLIQLFTLITSSAIMVAYIAFISWYVGIIALVGIVVLTTVEVIRHRVTKKKRKEEMEKAEQVSSLLNEVVRSQKDIKSLDLEEKLKCELIAKNDIYSDCRIKAQKAIRAFWNIRKVVSLCISTFMGILSLALMHKGLMILSTFMIIWTNRSYVSSLSNYISNLANYFSEIQISSERINDLFEDEEFELERFGTRELKNIKGKIEFKDVKFAYNQYKEKTKEEIEKEKKQNKKNKIKAKVKSRYKFGEKLVLENMNVTIEPNTTVAFVGKSGSGKSTILNLMAKMINVKSGKILLDGVNINTLSKPTLRKAISLVNQFPYIFDMTIKENLLLSKPDATEEEIEEAVKDSALKEFVDGLPEGLDTKVGESGIKLSGGQKQRLAIARALLRKTPIIIFDESTSSLDNISQNMVKKSIENIQGKSTVVIVAHRLSTIKNADVIFFLDEGKIVDQGTFKELYKRNKEFKKMFLAEDV